jgi:bis(5'-nucleosyl)-tetraphosphatase (symmetrical)
MNYLVGDIQGCCGALEKLLQKIAFSPSRDHLYVLGDMVNRGPQSLQTLRLLRNLGNAATCLLGNHDLSLLAVAHGVRLAQKGDTISEILDAPDAQEWLDWLRHRRLAVFEHGWLMVHAGVAPQWDVAQTLSLASEVEALLQNREAWAEFAPHLYGNQPAQWRDDLAGFDRLRFLINALTRTRFMAPDGTLDLLTKETAQAPVGLCAWFDAPGRRTQNTCIAFGHWAALGLVNTPKLLALDTGCVWGKQLTAARIEGETREIIQVDCAAST